MGTLNPSHSLTHAEDAAGESEVDDWRVASYHHSSAVNACSPVTARPSISACISCVPIKQPTHAICKTEMNNLLFSPSNLVQNRQSIQSVISLVMADNKLITIVNYNRSFSTELTMHTIRRYLSLWLTNKVTIIVDYN